jgi:hypothetical protein
MTDGWRPMRAADLDAVVAISDAVHGAFTEPRAVYAERLDLYPEGCRVFARGGAVAGFLVTHPWHRGAVPKIGALLGALPAPADIYYLHDIALLPAARGTGAGAAATASASVSPVGSRPSVSTVKLIATGRRSAAAALAMPTASGVLVMVIADSIPAPAPASTPSWCA